MRIRAQTIDLCKGLSAEDMVAQSMEDASPVKWHLAHTTWFFETFILAKFSPGYQSFDSTFPYLFNSYYEAQGARHARPQRGLLTRPPLDMVMEYRCHVEQAMSDLLENQPAAKDIEDLVTIGLHHEMQHQELMMTDLLHLFSCSPLLPALRPEIASMSDSCKKLSMALFDGGLVHIGASAQAPGFTYDCEQPEHKVWLDPFKLANRPVTNGEWLEFMSDGGYGQPLLWLADGWRHCQDNAWQAPAYWRQVEGQWQQFGLMGVKEVDLAAPVCHISYYEADAYARWSGKRLPTEQEWEHATRSVKPSLSAANFLESHQWRPGAATGDATVVEQLYGNVWEWTQSAFSPYPGFKPEQGALAEYNGKFMANQSVLRGGSCVTPRQQMRPSYRNFFYPDQRWQFSGVRLAETV